MSDAVASGSGKTRPVEAAKPLLDAVFGELWPEQAAPRSPRLVAASATVGLLAAAVVPWRDLGLGTLLVLLGMIAVPVAARLRSGRDELSRKEVGLVALCVGLVGTVVLRDAAWIVVLCVLAAFAVGSVTLAGGRSPVGMLASGLSVPLAGLRGLPWLGRSLAVNGTAEAAWPWLRTAALSVVLLAVFGALFASADAVFAEWVAALVPDLSVDGLVLRGFVLASVGGVTAAAAYVALVPPRVERLAVPPARAVRRFEWAVPVGLVVAVFVGFLLAQLTALFGGHGYLRRTTGLTYAEYVHQGFGQLTFATALVLLVVAAAARWAPKETVADRSWLRGLLGALCLLTLLVVGSALYRIHVYEEAYGFTQLRVLVSVFEAWLGVVVLLVLLAGLRLRGGWLPTATLVSGALMLLGLALANPDRYVAERNVERLTETGRVDWHYLSGLSADAAPALAELPDEYAACVLPAVLGRVGDDDWLEWNHGRARAADLPTPGGQTGCAALPSW